MIYRGWSVYPRKTVTVSTGGVCWFVTARRLRDGCRKDRPLEFGFFFFGFFDKNRSSVAHNKTAHTPPLSS